MTSQSVLNPAFEAELARWYELKPHPVQLRLVTDDVRFKVVPAGRRSGKTERAKRFIVREAMRTQPWPSRYFIAAPTRNQCKQIYWEDIKRLSFTSLMRRDAVRESDLSIKFPSGNEIVLIGLDQPQRIEGGFWAGGLIDEIADIKEDAWEVNISPALDTVHPKNPNYRAWCWLLGVPDGLNHYYDMALQAESNDFPDWALYTWPSSDILPPDVIEAAKRRLSAKQYKQEYEASFETASGKIYEDYSAMNHTSAKIGAHEQLLWFHDFNYTPLSSGIGVVRNETDLYVLDEIILTSAIARQSALEFCEKYKNHQNRKLLLFGDPAGRAGEKHGHASDYTEMEKVLRDNGWKVERRVKNKAPAIKDRQNAVRAKILNANGDISLFVNPTKAPYMHKGLATVQLKDGSTFLEEESKYQHITTAIGYCVDHIWPVKVEKEDIKVNPQPIKSHYGKPGK